MPLLGRRERPSALSIGVIFGGPGSQSAWEESVVALVRQVAALSDGVESTFNLNVVFFVPGSVSAPDFEGARTARFRRKDCHLLVQVALPADAPLDQVSYLRGAVQGAVSEAEKWNGHKNRGYDLSAVQAVASRI
jgi:hypothetical protein